MQRLKKGWLLRSGGARGADTGMETGCYKGNGHAEIFIPFAGFNNIEVGQTQNVRYIEPNFHSKKLQKLAAANHPNWEACDEKVRKFHMRNVCQILGEKLDSPTSLVICWTPGGEVVGGTGLALRLAQSLSIPVYNLGKDTEKVKEQLREILRA